MTWVKVCGLTREADVAAAINGGADAVGFVNVPSSPRFVSIERASQLAKGISAHTVLLTLDVEPAQVLQILEDSGMTGIQPYGINAGATARAAAAAGYLVLSPQRPTPELKVADCPGIALLDTPSQTALGGTGRVFDWSLAKGLAGRFVLAGGLGPDNVVTAVEMVRPWGVDASSRLELSPGRKDNGMVADFITKAKNT